MSMGIYLHIPFCLQKCAYCDFASYAGKLSLVPQYLEALAAEMEAVRQCWGRVKVSSLFMGGGTPSLLTGPQLMGLLGAVRVRFEVEKDAEITLEGNPGTLKATNLGQYRAAGVNRLSLGAQAFQAHHLEQLGRIHRWEDVAQGVKLAREAGFDNLNLDLMFGLPGQTLGEWRDTLEAALALGPEHLSCYGLIIEEGTPLWAAHEGGQVTLPQEELEREMYHLAQQTVAKAGLGQYELSNFALPGQECRHNLLYWTGGAYFGFGAAAHSHWENQRYGNTPDLAAYLARPTQAVQQREDITPQGALEEALMLGLRLTAGLSWDALRDRFGADTMAPYEVRAEELVVQGLLDQDPVRLRLTPRGMDIQNAVLVKLLG